VLRPVSCGDAMTADWTRVPYEVMARISTGPRPAPATMSSEAKTTMTTQRAAKKQAKDDPYLSPKTLRAMKKAAKTPLDQWITGTHAEVLAMGKIRRKKQATRKKKTRG